MSWAPAGVPGSGGFPQALTFVGDHTFRGTRQRPAVRLARQAPPAAANERWSKGMAQLLGNASRILSISALHLLDLDLTHGVEDVLQPVAKVSHSGMASLSTRSRRRGLRPSSVTQVHPASEQFLQILQQASEIE